MSTLLIMNSSHLRITKNNYVLLSLLQSCRAIQIAMTFFNRKIRTAASYQQVDFMRRRFDLFTLALRGVLPDIE